ncbi:MAG TPA: branched-chain amino acid ABC transporter substrate-binding protein [Gemmatimonadales bacterium]|nr:branched-chain amino acid ABC transporter substrate-binding protein [Gemmatimonadales bacterium]
MSIPFPATNPMPSPMPVGTALLAGCLLLAACRNEAGPVALGVAYQPQNLTLPAVELAIADLAAARQPGEPGIVHVVDSTLVGDAAETEVQRAESLVGTAGVVAVLGHSSSRGALAAAPVYDSAGIPQLTAIATSRRLQLAGPYTFALAPNDSVEGAFIGDFVAGHLGARRAALFCENDEYGRGLCSGVQAELARRDVQVVDRVPFSSASDYATLLEATALRIDPDVVIVAGRQMAVAAYAVAAAKHMPGVPVVAGDAALVLPDLADAAGAAIANIYVTSLWQPDAGNTASRRFIAAFQAKTGRPPGPFDALTYDAMMLLGRAIREAGRDPDEITEWLRDLGDTHPAYQGVTGSIEFGPERQSRLVMTRIMDGTPVAVP